MQEVSHKVIGTAAALGSAASWACGAILFKTLGERMSPMAMTLAKGAVSVLLLGVAVVFMEFHTASSSALWLLTLSGIIGIALGDTFFFKALQDLGPVSMIVLMMIGQVFTAVLGIVFLREMPPALAWAGMVLVLVGIAMVLRADSPETPSPTRMRGMIFGLASVICMAVSIVIAKQPLQEMPTIQATFLRMASGTVGLFLAGAMFGQLGGWVAPLKDKPFLAKFLLAVAVVTFGGFWLSLVAVKYLDVAVASTLSATEPIFVLPLAYFFLKDKVTGLSIVGAVTAVFGISLICFAPIQ